MTHYTFNIGIYSPHFLYIPADDPVQSVKCHARGAVVPLRNFGGSAFSELTLITELCRMESSELGDRHAYPNRAG